MRVGAAVCDGACLGREIIDGNFRIVYKCLEERIEVVTVFEGHRDFPVIGLE